MPLFILLTAAGAADLAFGHTAGIVVFLALFAILPTVFRFGRARAGE